MITLQTLYENYLHESESITIKALGADLVGKEGLRIYVMIGYEIITDSGIQLIANLRVNIED